MGSSCSKTTRTEMCTLEIRNPLPPKPTTPKPLSLTDQLLELEGRIAYACEKEDARLVLRLMIQKRKLIDSIGTTEEYPAFTISPPLTENGTDTQGEGSGQQGAGVARDSGPHLRRIEEEGSDEDKEGTHCQPPQACVGQEGPLHSEEEGLRGQEGNI